MSLPRRPFLRVFVVVAVTALGLAIAGSAYTATPGSGTVGPSNPTATWSGPARSFSDPNLVGDQSCTADDAGSDRVDLYTLTVSSPGDALVRITWADTTDDYDLYVCQDGKEINHSGGTTALDGKAESVFLPNASGDYLVKVYYFQTPAAAGYAGKATYLGISAIFDNEHPPRFLPSTVVSANFLGAEPQTTIERQVPRAAPDAGVDSRRVFVDWPVSSRSNIGQINRSLDHGESFRLLIDPACPQRSRPNCLTGGGGDTEEDVNPFNGQLLFADQESLAQESLSTSTDHGDTFPVDRQYAVSNTAADEDRQWLAPIDPSIASVGGVPLEGFLSWHLPAAGQYVVGIGTDGAPIPQPDPQIPLVHQSGQMRVDSSNGPGRGWIYQPYRTSIGHPLGTLHYAVATAYAPDYQDSNAWQSNLVDNDSPTIFPWLALDNHGNAYAVWTSGGVMFMSTSPIDDKANNPQEGGRPGTFWTPKFRVSDPSVGTAVFGEVIAGDPGRVAITYDGTTERAKSGAPDDVSDHARWNTYAAVITNALGHGGLPVLSTGIVSHRVIHKGPICTSGTTCTGDRSLLDMIDVNYDQSGRVGVVYTNNNSFFAQQEAVPNDPERSRSPFVYFAVQSDGPGLLRSNSTIHGTTPTPGSRTDEPGDATWPNETHGTNLPGLDILHATLGRIRGGEISGTIRLAKGTMGALAAALDGYNANWAVDPADRLQYVLRFEVPHANDAEDSTVPDEIYHLSMEFSGGQLRFFGGRLDDNDRLILPTSANVGGAGYHTDAGFPVTGKIRDHVTKTGHIYSIVFHAPAKKFGLEPGQRYVSATAFAMAGPSEEQELTVFRPMRTVDASPPWDGHL
jgi:hypothetical protein